MQIIQPISLYIHWPFCLSKCPYCDFNSHVRDRIPQARFRDALRRELAWEAERLGTRQLNSIFFGGGTPSLMEPETTALLIEDAKRLFPPAGDIEITLEANPTSVEVGRLQGFYDAGINRLSMGIQSLNQQALTSLGRQHSADQAITALEAARRIFPRLSFDLIYARPDQSESAWRQELKQALSLAADHLSLYQLTIEPGTQFETLYRRGDLVLPDDSLAARLYDATEEEAFLFGLQPYEVSNYAKPGAESRHNLAYWRYQDYAGIGPGAHGRISLGESLIATRRHRAPEIWAERVEKSGHGSTAEEVLAAPERAREMLLMGLRLSKGIDADTFEIRTGIPLISALDPAILLQAETENYLIWQNRVLRVTKEGRLRLDSLLAALIAD